MIGKSKVVGMLSLAMAAAVAMSAPVDAAKKPALSAKKATVTVGKTKSVTIKNAKAKDIKSIKWTTSKKKVATVKKKTKTKAQIKALKAGTATIKATFKVKSKKYKLSIKVTVKNPVVEAPAATEVPAVTEAPTATPVATVEPTATPTVAPTATPTVAPTATPAATENPSSEPDKPEFDEKGRKTAQVDALNAIIEAQNEAGAVIKDDLDSTDLYRWSDKGDLEKISWIGCKLQNEIDFSAFPELQELYLSSSESSKAAMRNPKLTKVNVSKNTKLVKLRVSYSGINSLNVSNCPELMELEVSGYSGNLMTLNVSKNKELVVLKCDNNQLEELDVSNLPNLRVLNCEANYIGVIDVTKNPELRELYCGDNAPDEDEYDEDDDKDEEETYTLDLSKNPLLEVISAEGLYLDTVKIAATTTVKTILLSDNYLADFDATKFTNLETLDISANYDLEELNVAGLKKLTELIAYEVPIYELDLSGCSALKSLDITDTEIEEIDLSETKITRQLYEDTLAECLAGMNVIDADEDEYLAVSDEEDKIEVTPATEYSDGIRVYFA